MKLATFESDLILHRPLLIGRRLQSKWLLPTRTCNEELFTIVTPTLRNYDINSLVLAKAKGGLCMYVDLFPYSFHIYLLELDKWGIVRSAVIVRWL